MSADAKRPEVEEKPGAADRPPDEPPPDLWAVSYDDDDDRELTTRQIEKALARKEIDGDTLVWHPGMPEWQALKRVEELRELIHTTMSVSGDPVGKLTAERPKSLPAAPEKPNSVPPPASDPEVVDPKRVAEEPAEAAAAPAPKHEDDAAPEKASARPAPAPAPATAKKKTTEKKTAEQKTTEKKRAAREEKREPPRAVPASSSSSKLPLILLGALCVGLVVWLTRREPPPSTATAEPTAKAAPTPTVTSPAPAIATTAPAAPLGTEHAAPTPTTSAQPSAAAAPPSPAPVASEPAPASPTAAAGAAFDKIAAMKILARDEFQAARCRLRAEPPGTAQVNVTFEPSGKVSEARILQRPYAATMTAKCIEAKLKKTQIPPFQGDPVTLRVPVILY
jgi:hypothetical protein